MVEEVRDSQARKTAYAAVNRIDKHEGQCALRYEAMEKAFVAFTAQLSAFNNRLWILVLGGYSVLFGLIAWLASRAF